MDALNEIIPILLGFCGVILLIVCIILVTRLISTIDKVNTLLDDVQQKSNKLNGLFDAVEKVTDTISSANNRVTGFFAGMAKKMFNERRKTTKKRKIVEESEKNE